jgi:hypothetical protein
VKSELLADEVGAIYSPDTSSDLALYKSRVTASMPSGVRGDFVKTVAEQVLPNFRMTPSLAVQLRLNEEAFEDWRSALAKLQIQTSALDEATATALIEAELAPAVRRVENASKKTGVLLRSWDQLAFPLMAELMVWQLGGDFGYGGPLTSALLLGKAGLTRKPGNGVDAIVATIVRKGAS